LSVTGPNEAHSQRVTPCTISIAKSIPVPLPYLTVLARATCLHDIGKMAIPDKILRKPGPLYDAEKVIMRTHCEIGYNMLTRIPFLREAADIVLAHHEFFDGTGYPRGLRGEQIPLGSRIISIANALDTMLIDWPYRNALPMPQAREEIRRCAGTQFDPKIVEVFLSIAENHWIELRENLGSPSPSLTCGIWSCPAVVPLQIPRNKNKVCDRYYGSLLSFHEA
jgi:putative nucleotidyltransferase with HDIG domain